MEALNNSRLGYRSYDRVRMKEPWKETDNKEWEGDEERQAREH